MIWDKDQADKLNHHLARNALSLSKMAEALNAKNVKVQGAFKNPSTPSSSEILDFISQRTFFDPASVDLAEAHAFKEICSKWNSLHGSKLKEQLVELGVNEAEAAQRAGVYKQTIVRLQEATVKPRLVSLVPLFDNLKLDYRHYVEIKDEPNSFNLFAQALRKLQEDNGLSFRSFAVALGVNHASLQSWLKGRSYPTGTVKKKLEYALGVSVEEAKQYEVFQKERLETPQGEGVGALIHQLRLEAGITREQLTRRARYGGDIKNIENGSITPTYAILRRLADALGVEYDIIALKLEGPQPMETFSQRLKAWRIMRLKTTVEMTKELGLENSQAYRNYEERNYYPSYTPGRVDAMAKALEIEVSDLHRPDISEFTKWLKSEITPVRTVKMLSLVAGVKEKELQDWLDGASQPTIKQAVILGRFCGYNRVFGRELITG